MTYCPSTPAVGESLTETTMAMVGFRSAVGEDDAAERTQKLFNLSLFADVCEDVVIGVETNYASNLDGRSTMLVMPVCQRSWTRRSPCRSLEISSEISSVLGCQSGLCMTSDGVDGDV